MAMTEEELKSIVAPYGMIRYPLPPTGTMIKADIVHAAGYFRGLTIQGTAVAVAITRRISDLPLKGVG